MADKNIKKVILIFKTHLDIGYTDTAENVINNYLNNYIPKAIALAEKYRGSKTPFIWTTGSWLINEGLKKNIAGLEKAIADGLIVYHGLPFTSHTELMSGELLSYGLSIAKKLDAKFGKKTIAAKMTDVPGHTIGLVPYLYDSEIEFLHIGVNEAAAKPPVPTAFKWKCGEKYVNVVYNQGGYGGDFTIGDVAVVFAHTNDNLGPQSDDSLIKTYAEVQSKYPFAEICAGTLDDFAKLLHGVDLPVIDKEIGDTWIHGAGTDPWKIKGYRETLRQVKNWECEDYFDNLLLVPEHTCGGCVQRYYTDTENYANDQFNNIIDDKSRSFIEKTWQEQRDYVKIAAKLTDFNLSEFMEVTFPDLSNAIEVDEKSPIELSWQLFGKDDYLRYEKQYLTSYVDWALWDNTKIGLPIEKGFTITATNTKTYKSGNKTIFFYQFSQDDAKEYGLPIFCLEVDRERYSVKMLGKRSSRLPQAIWLKFLGQQENWTFSKLGQTVNPEEILGSPFITAMDGKITNGDILIESLDAPLVAPFGRRLLEYGTNKGKQDLYFNLYNNIWNTNFPLWYADDIEYRFIIIE